MPNLLFYYTSLSVLVLIWISQNIVFIAYANQTLWKEKPMGVSSTPPLRVTEGLIYQQNAEQIERCMDQNLSQFI